MADTQNLAEQAGNLADKAANAAAQANALVDKVTSSGVVEKATTAATNAAGKAAEAAAKAPETAANVIQKAADAIPPGLLDKMGDGMLKMFDAAGEVLKQYGPDAAHLALMYVRVTGVVAVLEGMAMIALSAALVWALRFVWFPVKDKKSGDVLRRSLVQCWEEGIEDKREYGGSGKLVCALGTAVALVVGLILFINGAGHLFDIWNWVKVFFPEAGIVHDIYQGLIATPKK